MRARVPASTSNLGPGFDVLGLALSLYVEVEVRQARSLEIVTSGEGIDLPADEHHLAARIARQVIGHDRLHIEVSSQIPLGRGLGSSAALAVATAAAAGSPDPFGIGAGSDGHAENAAASFYGGLVAASFVDGAPVARSLSLDPSLCFTVVVPDRELATKTARSVLPSKVPFGDAVFDLGRLGLLLAGLSDASGLIAAAGEDRLHQDPRAALFPEARSLLATMSEAGATIACWSGAGPTMIGISTSREIAQEVRNAGERALAELGLFGKALVLEPDRKGLVLEES